MKLSLQIRAILTITLVAISQILFAQCPTISNVTTSTAVCAGGNITLEVTATSPDASTLSYAWFKNGAAIVNATTSRYEITNFQVANADVYFVKVSNACNTPTQSANITLTLKKYIDLKRKIKSMGLQIACKNKFCAFVLSPYDIAILAIL